MSRMRVSLGKADPDGGSRLRSEFAALWNAAGCPKGAIMYSYSKTRDRGNYYFNTAASTLAADLLRRYGAAACDEPDTSLLNVLVKAE